MQQTVWFQVMVYVKLDATESCCDELAVVCHFESGCASSDVG